MSAAEGHLAPKVGQPTRKARPAIAPAVQIDIEKFAVFAHAELMAAPLAPPGVCWNPTCSGPVEGRAGKKFCGDACRRAHDAELRLVGDRAALALLAWRNGKHAKAGTPEAKLAAKGRTFLDRLSSAWRADRARRRSIAGAK